MLKSTMFTCLILLSFCSSAKTNQNNKWYGLLTIDSFPMEHCKVYAFEPIDTWFSFMNSPVDGIYDSYSDYKQRLIDHAKRGNWNAIIGF